MFHHVFVGLRIRFLMVSAVNKGSFLHVSTRLSILLPEQGAFSTAVTRMTTDNGKAVHRKNGDHA